MLLSSLHANRVFAFRYNLSGESKFTSCEAVQKELETVSLKYNKLTAKFQMLYTDGIMCTWQS